MRIIVSKEEIRTIVLNRLKALNFKVKENTYTENTHVEGTYEDQREYFDGVSVEIE